MPSFKRRRPSCLRMLRLRSPRPYDQDLDHEGTTAATIRFEGGSRIPVGVTRKVFYASEALPLDGAEVDDANTDVVQSFTMERPLGSSMGHAFTLGERPYVDHPDGGLDPNTEYHVIVQDSRGSDDSELSDEFTGWTAPAVPDGYRVAVVGENSVGFSRVVLCLWASFVASMCRILTCSVSMVMVQ